MSRALAAAERQEEHGLHLWRNLRAFVVHLDPHTGIIRDMRRELAFM